MMCAINPMGASILGALVLHEQMTSSKLLGCLLIMGGLLVHFARREKQTTVKPVSYNYIQLNNPQNAPSFCGDREDRKKKCLWMRVWRRFFS